MTISYHKYNLQLIHPFGIANSQRTFTPVVFIEIHFRNLVGYGEASLPPYLPETQDSVISFLQKIDLSTFNHPIEINHILDYVNNLQTNNIAAKAAVDIALHDLLGKFFNKPWHKLYNCNLLKMPATSITIGIDKLSVIEQKVNEAKEFSILKVKLDANNPTEIINCIRQITTKPICVDANQAWANKEMALDIIEWLSTQNVIFIEQPMPKSMDKETAWLKQKNILPIIADESFQTIADIEKMAESFNGINIKLMKCGGMREAYKIIEHAKQLKLKVLIGCMNESSCANLAAAQLAPLANWVDLDGPFMINNNPFENPALENGKIMLNENPGLGLNKLGNF